MSIIPLTTKAFDALPHELITEECNENATEHFENFITEQVVDQEALEEAANNCTNYIYHWSRAHYYIGMINGKPAYRWYSQNYYYRYDWRFYWSGTHWVYHRNTDRRYYWWYWGYWYNYSDYYYFNDSDTPQPPCSDYWRYTYRYNNPNYNYGNYFWNLSGCCSDGNQDPVANCRDVTVSADANCSGSASAADVNAGSYDPDGDALTYTLSPAGPYALGTTNVTLTVDDGNGGSSSCSATITVIDDTAPNMLCQDVTLYLDASGNVSITADKIDNGSTDNCSDVALSLDGQTSFGCSDLDATHTVTLTGTDDSGNSNSCTATITVIDNTAPTTLCQDITVYLDATGHASISAYDVDNGSSDNCSVALSLDGQTSFDCSDLDATYTVTLTGTDPSGNSSSCTATVTVSDDTLPDEDCDGVSDICDICPGGDDSIDNNNDGIADCSQLLDYADYSDEWKCANNKIAICHNGNTLCVSKNALSAHFDHGDFVGGCQSCDDANARLAQQDIHIHEEIELHMNPNPSNGVVNVHWHDDMVSGGQFIIYDQLGRSVYTQTLGIGENQLQFDGNELQFNKGIYYITIVTDKYQVQEKLIFVK